MSIESFIEKISVQTAVYWGNPQPDGFGGLTFDDPIEIPCRWQSVNVFYPASKALSSNFGEFIIITGEILTPVDLEEGGYLYLGTLDDFEDLEFLGETKPKEIPGTSRILKWEKTPMIKSTTQFVRKAYI